MILIEIQNKKITFKSKKVLSEVIRKEIMRRILHMDRRYAGEEYHLKLYRLWSILNIMVSVDDQKKF